MSEAAAIRLAFESADDVTGDVTGHATGDETGHVTGNMTQDVLRGLTASRKTLPSYLFYDTAGSRLYEQITDLPEYYLTRAERSIFEEHADAIVAWASRGATAPLGVIELGAGSASKTEVLLRAVLDRQASCNYVPIDVSRTALEGAERRLRTELPRVHVRSLVMTHDQALRVLPGVGAPQVVLFIGSSVGNFDDATAASLLGGLRAALGPEALLVLGTDLRKSPDVLLPAYDDAAGVTAAFNKNILTRINRELGGRFHLDHFRHVARWNDGASRIEMHLESVSAHDVAIQGLGLRVHFDAGETIHTESSNKYDIPRVTRLLAQGGFALEKTLYDGERRFGLHLARAVGAWPKDPADPHTIPHFDRPTS
jgi:L-histidine Nalpha-methyltransferase